jgi:hypothetical protein
VVTKPKTTTYAVHFTVSGFTEQVIQSIGKKAPASLRTSSVNTDTSSTDTLNVLYYEVYDSTGKVVNQIVQQNTDSNFGSISDNLPSGTYTIAFVAGKTGLTYTATGFDLPNAYFYYADTIGWHDTFFKKITLTVVGGAVNQNVTLSRIVAQLEVNINDAIPSNAAKILVTVNDDWGKYYIDRAQVPGNPEIITSVIPAAAKGTTNYQVYGIFANTLSATSVQIACYDASNNLIGSSLVNGVTFAENTRTILSGDLFGGNTAFQISLNDTWNPNVYTIQY